LNKWFQSSVSVPAGTTFSYLSSVSCHADSPLVTHCEALGTAFSGSTATVFGDQWNGYSWEYIAAPTPPASGSPPVIEASGMDCTGPGFCVAVGTTNSGGSGLPFAELWNGSSWSLIDNGITTGLNGGSRLSSVSCTGGANCQAVGVSAGSPNKGLIENWNGLTWVTEAGTPQATAFSETLTGIDCFSPTSCSAVGYADQSSGANPASVALEFNNASWSLVPNTPNKGNTELLAETCLSDWACLAVGEFGAATPATNTFAISAPIARSGYRFVASDGGVFAYGAGAPFLGSAGGTPLNAPVVGMGVMPAGDGYYLVASDGGVFNYGSAIFYGSAGGMHLNKPVVGMAVLPNGGGYWLVASDGGIFAYGNAGFYGSTGGMTLNEPIVGMASTPDGRGYYLVAADGGIFAFGDAFFSGSTGGMPLNKPVVGMAVTTSGGYYLVASDGGTFSFPTGTAGPPFYGSTGGIALNKPIVGMTTVQGGYYLTGSDGGVFAFPPGGPPFNGSTGSTTLNKPIVGIAS
jgi:hypothetical protein